MVKQVIDTGIRQLHFNFTNPVVATVYDKTQKDQAYRLTIELPEGPLRFTYQEWIRFAQTVTTVMRPTVLLED